MRSTPTTGRLLGALRYGPSAAAGPDPASRFLEMSPAELRELDCAEWDQNYEVFISAARQFTDEQNQAIAEVAIRCTRIGEVREGVLDPIGWAADALESALSSAVGSLADVIANTVLALAGVALVVIGVGRIFGVTPARVAGAALPVR